MARRKSLPPDKKDRRPETRGAARLLIEKTFRENGWGARERATYFSMPGVEGTDSADDIRKIIADFDLHKMILFE